jgi:hypothetical protein
VFRDDPRVACHDRRDALERRHHRLDLVVRRVDEDDVVGCPGDPIRVAQPGQGVGANEGGSIRPVQTRPGQVRPDGPARPLIPLDERGMGCAT